MATTDVPASLPAPAMRETGTPASRDAAMLHWVQQLAPHGIFTTDTELRIQTWNNWLETHSGLSSANVRGKLLVEIFPDLLARKVDNLFRHALEGQVSIVSTALHRYLLPLPVTVRDSNFQQMQQTARIGPLLSNRVVCGTIATIEDVTQREVQTAALAAHAVELETKVKERTALLDETVAQLEGFSYTVAHDLRAPIRTFRGFTEILLEDFSGEFPEKAREYLERMKRAAEGMDLLTRDLLHFSKISRQQISAEPINVTDLLKEIVAHTPALQEPDVLSVRGPIHPVVGNRTMLQQCLSNLLDNAVKFVAADRPVRIIVQSELQASSGAPVNSSSLPLPFQGATQDISPPPAPSPAIPERTPHGGDARVRIYIEDNGIGIAPEHHRQVFGIFERIQGAKKFEGTGIGLAIVARAVQRMNGRCGVESSLGHGSRFWIELPATNQEPHVGR